MMQWIPRPGQDRFTERLIMVVLVAGLIIVGGNLFLKWLFRSDPIDPIYEKVEAIRRVRDLHLVKHHYETVIPITKAKRNGEQGKLQFLLTTPAEISGFIDLSQTRFALRPDSLLLVQLPPAKLSKVHIDLRETEEYQADRRKLLFGKSIQRASYFEVYDQIRQALTQAKDRVRQRAIVNGIESETQSRAEMYLRNQIAGLGYRVEFLTATDSTSQARLDLMMPGLMSSELSRLVEEAQSSIQSGRRAAIRQALGF
ncbi:MAG: DUF4230 domain-containing protein [Bacteroidota bacterium]